MIEKIKTNISKIADINLLKSIRFGLMYTIPVVLIGSLEILLLNFPIKTYHNMMNLLFKQYWVQILNLIREGTYEIMAMIVVISISYSIVKENKEIKKNNINTIIPVLIVFGCFLITIFTENFEKKSELFGTRGLFLGIIISSLASKVFIWFFEHRIFKPKFLSEDGDLVINQSLNVLEPAILTFVIFSILKVLTVKFEFLVFLENIYSNFIHTFINLKSNFWFGILSTFVSQILWFFGIHGNNILDNVNNQILNNSITINQILVSNGLEATKIISKQFFDVFVYLGGAGSTLCLITAMILTKSRKESIKFSLISIIPGLFNINEITMYGLPVVFNPFLLVPMVITPLILTIFTYIVMLFKIVPVVQVEVTWTTPIIIGGYLSTGNNISGSILQIINLLIGTIIYMPFVKMYDEHIINSNKKILNSILQDYNELIKTKHVLVKRNDEVGFLVRNLAKEIKFSIRENKNPMHLEYQPQCDKNGNVVGCECLLRWNHYNYGFISPYLIVLIAEEANIMNELGNWIIKTAFKDLKDIVDSGIDTIMSINLSATQIENPKLINFIETEIQTNNINPKNIGFELTEGIAIDVTDEIKARIKKLQKLGFEISIDDFGMGHSSLLYIKNFSVDKVKLDGSIVTDILTNKKSQEIVTSITNLCKMLNLGIIAEIVETKSQIDLLNELGCNIFQGYYFSKSLKKNDFINYFYKNL